MGHVRTTDAPGHRLDLAVAIRRQAASNAYNNGNVYSDAQLARMYEAGDASFIANVGALVEPMTKEEYLAKSKRRPQSLYAHNVQQNLPQAPPSAGASQRAAGRRCAGRCQRPRC